jgi:hypothetical protein
MKLRKVKEAKEKRGVKEEEGAVRKHRAFSFDGNPNPRST